MRNSILFLLFFISVLVGQASFTANNVMQNENQGARTVYPVDMDNDGDIDIVCGGIEVQWYENNGSEDPSFTTHTIASNIGHSRDLYAVDIDNDGDIDVLSGTGNSTIRIYQNNGSESFTEFVIAINTNVIGVYAADMDNDGDLDILEITSESGSDNDMLNWYENNTNEWRDKHTITNTLNGASSLLAVDMDNDGDMDVLLGQFRGDKITWFENNGSQVFTIHTWAVNEPKVVHAADVDRDGDMDVVSGSLMGELAWHENDGNENFTEHVIELIVSSSSDLREVHAADLDGDGDIDVSAIVGIPGSSSTQEKIIWYENNGSQSFTSHTIDTSTNQKSESIYAADMDSDGDMDLLAPWKTVTSQVNNKVVWYENTMEKGMIAGWTQADITTSVDGPLSVFSVDLDQDGDFDILSASSVSGDGDVDWFENDGNESFTKYSIATNLGYANSVFSVDLDRDGDMDVVASGTSQLVWYNNNGSESFTSNVVVNAAFGSTDVYSIYCIDLDLDGDIDILATQDGYIKWYENNGSESFTARTINAAGSYGGSIYSVDLDDDGDFDIIVSDNGSTQTANANLTWYENNGSQSFTSHTIDNNNNGYQSVYVIDLDKDGDQDIISTEYHDYANSGPTNVYWYKNNGSQSFTEQTIYTGNADQDMRVDRPYAVDLDKDGDLDVLGSTTVKSGVLGGLVLWFENNGSQSFTAHTIGTFSGTASSIFPIDVDQDGNIDIVASGQSDDKIRWYKNEYDAVVPTVSSVSSTNDNGTYKIGDVIAVTVAWSEAATVTGTPRIKLETGTTDQYATYASGSTTTTLTFNYTVTAGDTTTDLDYTSTSALELNGGTIKDVSGNNATLTLPSPGATNSLGANKAIVIDGNVPTVSSVSSTKANGGYTVGDTIPITITFTQTVTVTGTPQLTLVFEKDPITTLDVTAAVDYVSGTGTATLTFNYIVAAGHNSGDLDYTSTSALALNSGTIKDASGNVATLTLPTPGATNSLGANKALIIDTTGPTVSSVSSTKDNAAYKVGELIPINVLFDDKVYVTGTPQLTLETGDTDAVVDYTSGSGTDTLTFNYTVESTHNSSDLDYTSTSALALNSGTVKDSLGNVATLTLPAPGATNSLGANKAIIIDNLPPTVTLDPADGSLAVLPTEDILITFNEYVRLTDNTEATSTNVDALITLKDTDANGTDIPFNATINSSKTEITIDPTADFASEQIVYVAISASLEDTLDHAAPAASATLKMKDVIVPTVTFDPTNGSTDIPGNRNITLTFSESIRKIDNGEITDANIAGLIDLKGNNASGADFSYGATINADKTVITVDPLFDFSASSVVYVGIGAVVEDDADNAIVPSSVIYITGIPDVIGPAVTNVTSANADSSYKDGSSIIITVSFDEAAIVTGTPQLTLETGATDGVANYTSGSGTKDLYFTYNVTSDHNIAHLDYESSNALTKNEGTIKDAIGNNANLTLPNPGAENSLGANKNIVIDHFIPVISLVSEGTLTGEDKDYQTIATAMDISWAGTDTISGISKYEYALGTSSGGTEVKTWTDAALVTSISLSNLSLNDGTTYYASVRATDKANNVSLIKTGDGITIDLTAPTVGTVNDGAGEDIAEINSTTTLSANWTGFSDANSGIASYDYAIGTTSGGTDTKNWTSNGLETTVTLTDLNLTYTQTYFVSVRANDNAGNISNVATSNGVVVDLYPGPPSITAVSIESNSTLPVLTSTKVDFTISEPVTSANSEVTSNLGDTVLGTLSIENDTEISIDLAAPFTSGDEITVTIDTLTDQLGNITNNLVYNYNIALIADYNVDGSIDAADLTVLLSGWTNKDYAYELGPATGDVPNLKPSTDGKFDIMDAAVLIRMWHWNLNKAGKMQARYVNTGKELIYINENNSLSIQVPKDVNAVDFYFDYPREKLSIKQFQGGSSNKEIILSNIDTLNGEFLMTAGYLEPKLQSIEVPYTIKGRENVTITAIYRMFNNNGEIISQGTREIDLKPVPKEFALHQNYPNPFNPITTINYDLPQQTHVNLMIYDILGREVVKLVSSEIPAGYQSVIWNTRNSIGTPVSAGIYFYQIQTKGFVKTKKMVLLK